MTFQLTITCHTEPVKSEKRGTDLLIISKSIVILGHLY